MDKARIIRVWGRADDLELSFVQVDETNWKCAVPPDTQDGTYACEFIAEDELGQRGYWVGFLYMLSGGCHFNIYPVNNRLFFHPLKERLILEKRCPHGY